MTPLQNLSKNVGDLGQLVVAKGFKKLPKVQKIAKSGHTDRSSNNQLSTQCHVQLHAVRLDLAKFRYIWQILKLLDTFSNGLFSTWANLTYFGNFLLLGIFSLLYMAKY